MNNNNHNCHQKNCVCCQCVSTVIVPNPVQGPQGPVGLIGGTGSQGIPGPLGPTGPAGANNTAQGPIGPIGNATPGPTGPISRRPATTFYTVNPQLMATNGQFLILDKTNGVIPGVIEYADPTSTTFRLFLQGNYLIKFIITGNNTPISALNFAIRYGFPTPTTNSPEQIASFNDLGDFILNVTNPSGAVIALAFNGTVPVIVGQTDSVVASLFIQYLGM